MTARLTEHNTAAGAFVVNHPPIMQSPATFLPKGECAQSNESLTSAQFDAALRDPVGASVASTFSHGTSGTTLGAESVGKVAPALSPVMGAESARSSALISPALAGRSGESPLLTSAQPPVLADRIQSYAQPLGPGAGAEFQSPEMSYPHRERVMRHFERNFAHQHQHRTHDVEQQ